uniref:Saposin B-type domain-containing protein n=1 Tax=Steinernema glaseri TaxID=37863 RepID=A0A1I7YLR6_9BILA
MKSFAVIVLVALVGASLSSLIHTNEHLCQLCQDVVTKSENATESADQWLKEHSAEVCDHFRTHIGQNLCKDALQKIGAVLDDVVSKQVPPKEACEKVKLC